MECKHSVGTEISFVCKCVLFSKTRLQYVVKERALIFLTKGEGIYGRVVNI